MWCHAAPHQCPPGYSQVVAKRMLVTYPHTSTNSDASNIDCTIFSYLDDVIGYSEFANVSDDATIGRTSR